MNIENNNGKIDNSFLTGWMVNWLTPLLNLGNQRPLEFDDMYDLEPKTQVIRENIEREWNNKSSTSKSNNLLNCLWNTFKYQFLKAIPDRLVYAIVEIFIPYVIKMVISYVQLKDKPTYNPFLIIFLIITIPTIRTMTLQRFWFQTNKAGQEIRAGMMSFLHSKLLRVSSKVMNTSEKSQIINLLSNDTLRLENAYRYLHFTWATTLLIIFAFIFSVSLLGFLPSVGSFLFFSLSIPLSIFFARRSNVLRKNIVKRTDERVSKSSEVLHCMETIKLYVIEEYFLDKVLNIREKELQQIKMYQITKAIHTFINSITIPGTICVSFLIFVLTGGILNPVTAFTTISLISILKLPFTQMNSVLSSMVEASIAIKRLEDFLNIEEKQPINIVPSDHHSIKVVNGNFSWDFREEEKKLTNGNKFSLKNVNLDIKKGDLVAVVGKVGSGKSSLLHALMMEMKLIPSSNSKIEISENLSFLSQKPFLFFDTIRDNITLGIPYDKERYERVIKACALDADFSKIPNGDQNFLGEGGKNLSGGQKMRISLARTLYSNTDLYLLDDPFSSLDVNVAQYVYGECIENILSKKTRVLVTHHINLILKADKIIVMNNGEIEAQGTFEELTKNSPLFTSLISELNTNETKSSIEGTKTPKVQRSDSREILDVGPQKGDIEENQFIKERREYGGVKLGNYWNYFKSSPFYWSSSFIFIAISSAFGLYQNFYLSQWAQSVSSHNKYQNSNNLFIYFLYASGLAISLLIHLISNSFASITSSTFFHDILIKSVFRIKKTVFESIPLGRFQSRFSTDIDHIDNILSDAARDTQDRILQIISTIIIIITTSSLGIYAVLLILSLFYFQQRYFRRSSREIVRLKNIAQTDITSKLNETINGLKIIRNSGIRNVDKIFINKIDERVDIFSRCTFINTSLERWLTFRSSIISTFALLFISLYSIVNKDHINPSYVGLALSYSTNCATTINWLIKSFAALESNMNSVERIVHFSRLEQEKKYSAEEISSFDKNWPVNGEINFEDATLGYNSSKKALKNLKFKIEGKTSVGVVGRTGAGKSSIFNAILRLVELESGKICIDGVDIKTIPIPILRRQICAIPQDPVLFHDSIRFNLCFQKSYDENMLWNVLETVGLLSRIKSFDKGLETVIETSTFSVGESQLICVARALLLQSKIIIIDEGTSGIDNHSERFLQNTLKNLFTDRTSIIIAHRLETITKLNWVLVVRDGEIIEYDRPDTLLSRNSVFAQMVEMKDKKEFRY